MKVLPFFTILFPIPMSLEATPIPYNAESLESRSEQVGETVHHFEKESNDLTCQKAMDRLKEIKAPETGITGETVRENLKNKNYIKALKNILSIVFFNQGKTNFNEFTGDGFMTLSQDELQKIYVLGIYNNPQVQEIRDKIEVSENVNEKLGLGYLLTQIQDYILWRKTGETKPDIDLLSPHLKVGSIILMRQEREQVKIQNRIGDAGMILKDNATITDFTHAAIINEVDGQLMITHATMDAGVHSEPLEQYLANFSRTNLVVLNPKRQEFGTKIASSCLSYSRVGYDKSAPVESFLGGIFLGKDDKNKTNCVEFIADSLFELDSKYSAIKDAAHPNQLLQASKNGFELSYVKTYRRDKLANDARAKRMFSHFSQT